MKRKKLYIMTKFWFSITRSYSVLSLSLCSCCYPSHRAVSLYPISVNLSPLFVSESFFLCHRVFLYDSQTFSLLVSLTVDLLFYQSSYPLILYSLTQTYIVNSSHDPCFSLFYFNWFFSCKCFFLNTVPFILRWGVFLPHKMIRFVFLLSQCGIFAPPSSCLD